MAFMLCSRLRLSQARSAVGEVGRGRRGRRGSALSLDQGSSWAGSSPWIRSCAGIGRGGCGEIRPARRPGCGKRCEAVGSTAGNGGGRFQSDRSSPTSSVSTRRLRSRSMAGSTRSRRTAMRAGTPACGRGVFRCCGSGMARCRRISTAFAGRSSALVARPIRDGVGAGLIGEGEVAFREPAGSKAGAVAIAYAALSQPLPQGCALGRGA